MGRFAELDRCADLTPAHAREAAESSALMRSFLEWASRSARAEEGAPKVLLAVAALVEASWIEGNLYVDITGTDSVTRLSIYTDYGFGIRERLLPSTQLDVPFDEFVRAVRLSPKLIAPFRAEQLDGSLILTPPRGAAVEEDGIAISEASMLDDVPKTPPPPASQPEAPAAAGVTQAPPAIPEKSGIHTHPTVRRMVAVRPEALRSGNDD